MAKGKFGIGLVVGAIAGAVAGLLTAPKSGKETRADLKHKADTVKAETSKRVEEARTKATVAAEEAKKTAERMKHVADSATEGVKEGFGKARTHHDEEEKAKSGDKKR